MFGPMGCGNNELDLRPPKRGRAMAPIYTAKRKAVDTNRSEHFVEGPTYVPTVRQSTRNDSRENCTDEHSVREHPISRCEWDRRFRML